VSGPSGPPPLLAPGARAAVQLRLGRLTVDDLRLLDAAVRALREAKPYRSRVDMGFAFAWYEGPPLTRTGEGEIADLFGVVVVAIAGGLTGLDVERFGARPKDAQPTGVLGDVMRFLRPGSADRSRQDAAIGLIEGAVAPWDPRLAIVACWNVTCAAALRTHLPVGVVEVLEAAWRRALGEPPA
jgi:hypothetical protein